MQEDVITDSEKRRFTVGRLILILALVFGAGLGGGLLVFRKPAGARAHLAPPSPSLGSPTTSTRREPTARQVVEDAEYLEQLSSPEEMFSEFTCPCCGKLIGECTCGMAAERKEFLAGQVSAGRNKLQTYVAYGQRYGWDGFVSQEAQSVARAFLVAHAPAARPEIVLEPQKANLGEVSSKKGKVSTSVTVRNSGREDLVVKGLSTSCGCTTVSLVSDGIEGPLFGVGAQPAGWSATIPPGRTAELRILYDPSFHKEARGPMIREVYVSSNDPINGLAKAIIELVQVD